MADAPRPATEATTTDLGETLGRALQMQVALVSNTMKSSMEAFESINKLSLDLAGNAAQALNQALQNLSSSIAPKKNP